MLVKFLELIVVLTVTAALPAPESTAREYIYLVPQIPKVQVQPTLKFQSDYFQAVPSQFQQIQPQFQALKQ